MCGIFSIRKYHICTFIASWYKLSNVFWDPKEIHCFLDKRVPYWAIYIFNVKPNDMKFGWFIISGRFYSVPQHGCMFDATWKTRNSSFLNRDIHKYIVQYESHHSLSNEPAKDFPLNKEIGRNCSWCLEFFSIGIYIPSANPQSSAMIFKYARLVGVSKEMSKL